MREIKSLTNLTDWKASQILFGAGQLMTCAFFMMSRDAVLNEVMLSTTLPSPMIEKDQGEDILNTK